MLPLPAPVCPVLARVGLGPGADGPSARQGPDQESRLWLRELPALLLLGAVVPATKRIKVAFARFAAFVVRDRVVVIAPYGPPAASGEPTPRGADLHDVPQAGGGPVPG